MDFQSELHCLLALCPWASQCVPLNLLPSSRKWGCNSTTVEICCFAIQNPLALLPLTAQETCDQAHTLLTCATPATVPGLGPNQSQWPQPVTVSNTSREAPSFWLDLKPRLCKACSSYSHPNIKWDPNMMNTAESKLRNVGEKSSPGHEARVLDSATLQVWLN